MTAIRAVEFEGGCCQTGLIQLVAFHLPAIELKEKYVKNILIVQFLDYIQMDLNRLAHTGT